MSDPPAPSLPRARRQPPTLRPTLVLAVDDRTPRLRRITLGSEELRGLPEGGPAASVRLLPPRDGAIELPIGNGNEWRYADGTRPPIRTLTPVRIHTTPAAGTPQVDVDVVLHGDGPLSSWAAGAAPGAPAALAGTGRGYDLDPQARHMLLAGDESALPAIEQLLGVLPTEVEVQVVVHADGPEGRLDLPARPGTSVTWCDDLAATVASLPLADEVRVWAAGEAAEMQRIRRHLFDERGLERSRCVIRGYWKRGRAGASD